MRLAFVDNLPVGGGLSRFSLLLCKNLVEYFPQLTVDYYIHYQNLDRIPEIKNINSRVSVKLLHSTKPANTVLLFASKILSRVYKNNSNTDKVISEVQARVNSSYDLAYFPSAHMMKRPDLTIPVVGTLHDFNWKYFFGRQIFSLSFVNMMDAEILQWMDKGLNICSSEDVVNEAKKLYPNAKNLPYVIPIAPVIFNSSISDEKASQLLKERGIDFPYIIFPGNFFPHKNHLNLFTAFSMLVKRKGFENYKLLLTGVNSEQVSKGIAEERGVQLVTKNSVSSYFNVIGMGYQSNEVIDALISKARLLVSPSIYEAICTPGMDAWNFGTPTAISDIPPFREHEKTWGIRTAFFDPMDPKNIADTLENYLNNYENALADAKLSRINMAKYTWKEVTMQYMEIFEKAIAGV